MSESINLKTEEQLQETLDLLEQMQEEMELKDLMIAELQQQQNVLLNLNEKLNSENKIENIQALKKDLEKTETLLMNEKEVTKQAGVTIEKLQDKLNNEKQARLYAEENQKTVERPVEKLVLYERCEKCVRKEYIRLRELYQSKVNKLEDRYKIKMAGLDSLLYGFVLYSLMITIFQMVRTKVFVRDFKNFIGAIWKGIILLARGVKEVASYLAGWSDVISNEMVETIVYWIIFTVVVVAVLVILGFVIVKMVVKIKEAYEKYCWDKITIIVTTISLAVLVWFGDVIRCVMPINIVVILLLVQVIYAPLRWYIRGCRIARGILLLSCLFE